MPVDWVGLSLGSVRLRSKLVALSVVLSFVAGACGGGAEPVSTSTAVSEPSTAVSRPSTTISEPSAVTSIAGQPDGVPIGPERLSIGPDGGTVTSEDGMFTVEIPAGALSKSVHVGVEIISAEEVGVEGSLLAGPVYQLTPDGVAFNTPVITVRTLSASALGVSPNAVPLFHVLQGKDDRWVPLSTDTTRDGDQLFVRAETTHFSPNVVVETTQVFGYDVELALTPATFTIPVHRGEYTEWSVDEPIGLDIEIDPAALLFSGALKSHDQLWASQVSAKWMGRATCGETPGDGTFGIRIDGKTGDDQLVTPVDAFFRIFLGITLSPVPITVSAHGEATCTKLDTSIVDAVSGVASGSLHFQPHENSPQAAPYTAEYEYDIERVGDGYVITKTQKPRQITKGPIDPTTGIFFTSARTDVYFDAYIGVVCPLGDGSYWTLGFGFGGSPSMPISTHNALDFENPIEPFQELLALIPRVDGSVSLTQYISVDPALAPNCDGVESDPWALAGEIRRNLGPQGPIPDAQWDNLFSGHMQQDVG